MGAYMRARGPYGKPVVARGHVAQAVAVIAWRGASHG